MKNMINKIKNKFSFRPNRRPIISLTTIFLCICISIFIWAFTCFNERDYLLNQKDFIASDFSNIYLLDDYTISNNSDNEIVVCLDHESYFLCCHFDENFAFIDYHFNASLAICHGLFVFSSSFVVGIFFALLILKIAEKFNIIDPVNE